VARAHLLTAVASALLLGSCAALGPPQLVRDELGLFSADARSAAEDRLRELAAETGIWVFVVSDAGADPPRMLAAPMGEADDAGVPGVAVLFGPETLAGSGLSERANQSFSSLDFVAVDQAFQAGDVDAALDLAVDVVVDWVERGMPRDIEGPPIQPGPS
jgi:hypothetical protein